MNRRGLAPDATPAWYSFTSRAPDLPDYLVAAMIGCHDAVPRRATLVLDVMDSDALEFRSPHGSLRISCSAVNPGKIRLPGVQHLRYSVEGNGFSGAGDGFVDARDLRKFCVDLRALLEGRSQPARLQAHPTRGGLSLEVRPGPETDSLAVVGYIAMAHFRALTEADGLYQWRTEFGFSVRREGLASLGKVKWVSAYAV
jgi:hypothetical protein